MDVDHSLDKKNSRVPFLVQRFMKTADNYIVKIRNGIFMVSVTFTNHR